MEEVLYDFKLFIKEGLFYNYTDSLLSDFALFMDDLYCPTTRDYYKMFISIMENRDILFTNSTKCSNHILDIKYFIDNYCNRYHLTKISDENKKYYDIALYDFSMFLKSNDKVSFSDLYGFAYYMQGFYKKIPYYEVANLLYSLKNNRDNLIDINFYLKFLTSDCINLDHFTAGHFMEICNYKVLVKE